MGSVRSMRRFIEGKKKKTEIWVAGSQDAIFIHFMNRPLMCENCADLAIGVCPGKGLKGYEEIKACMDGKLVEVVHGSTNL